jgi:hypothetical protein
MFRRHIEEISSNSEPELGNKFKIRFGAFPGMGGWQSPRFVTTFLDRWMPTESGAATPHSKIWRRLRACYFFLLFLPMRSSFLLQAAARSKMVVKRS